MPTSATQPDSAPAAFAIARFLYADSVVSGANDALANQVPAAERFLTRMTGVLGDAIAEIPKDEAYAASNGTSGSRSPCMTRELGCIASAAVSA